MELVSAETALMVVLVIREGVSEICSDLLAPMQITKEHNSSWRVIQDLRMLRHPRRIYLIGW